MAFPIVINGREKRGEISEGALMDHFGADSRQGQSLLNAFDRNRRRIEAKAAELLPDRLMQGRGLLRTGDF